MKTAIRQVVRMLAEEKWGDMDPWAYDQILLDCTGGPKLASISAAAATLSSDLVFSYAEGSQVWMLDARSRLGRADTTMHGFFKAI